MIFSAKGGGRKHDDARRRSGNLDGRFLARHGMQFSLRQRSLVRRRSPRPRCPGHEHRRHPAHNVVAQPQPKTPAAADASPVIARMGDIEVHSGDAQKLIASLSPTDRATARPRSEGLRRVLGRPALGSFPSERSGCQTLDQQPAVAEALETAARERNRAKLSSVPECSAGRFPKRDGYSGRLRRE